MASEAADLARAPGDARFPRAGASALVRLERRAGRSRGGAETGAAARDALPHLRARRPRRARRPQAKIAPTVGDDERASSTRGAPTRAAAEAHVGPTWRRHAHRAAAGAASSRRRDCRPARLRSGYRDGRRAAGRPEERAPRPAERPATACRARSRGGARHAMADRTSAPGSRGRRGGLRRAAAAAPPGRNRRSTRRALAARRPSLAARRRRRNDRRTSRRRGPTLPTRDRRPPAVRARAAPRRERTPTSSRRREPPGAAAVGRNSMSWRRLVAPGDHRSSSTCASCHRSERPRSISRARGHAEPDFSDGSSRARAADERLRRPNPAPCRAAACRRLAAGRRRARRRRRACQVRIVRGQRCAKAVGWRRIGERDRSAAEKRESASGLPSGGAAHSRRVGLVASSCVAWLVRGEPRLAACWQAPASARPWAWGSSDSRSDVVSLCAEARDTTAQGVRVRRQAGRAGLILRLAHLEVERCRQAEAAPH